MKPRCILLSTGLVLLIACALVLPALSVCRDWAFIDRNTGSCKGYRQWFPGWRSGSWSTETEIERFMRVHHPAEFRQNWVSYAGTGRNIFGRALSFSHDRPGPIVVLRPEVINDYCRSASDAEKRRLYDVFSGGNREEILDCVDLVLEAVLVSKENAKLSPGKQP